MAPKFPSPANLEFLLAHFAANPGTETGQAAAAMALHTLRGMATGGMYDQVGGGFARYSVDEAWVVPHFEKMLYDNAQLARVYLHGYQLTGDGGFARVVHETLEFLLREMQDPAGGFYAALDADSEGIEGKYYLWTVPELEQVLGPDAPLAMAWYGVTPEGNFRDPHHPELTGRSVLTARPDIEDLERRFGLSQDEILDRIEEIRERLFYARQERVPPGLDDKVLTDWNGLALAAFAEAARVLEEPAYAMAATRLAEFLRANLWRDGVLYHTWKAGEARVPGMLEDYTYLGLGLVELYKTTGDLAWLDWARDLWEAALARFRDPQTGTFFDTASDAEQLIVRQRSFSDAATPSGNGAAALLGLWLGRYYGPAEWERVVEDVVAAVADHLLRAVTGFGTILHAMEFALAPHREIVIVGDPSARAPFEGVLAARYLPFTVVAPTADAEGLPLFEGREPAGRALAYVCENMACMAPTESPADLERQLGPAPAFA
ncbi:hypothetical protein O0235_00635 [Tepidiforma flava]|uniref:Thioredoxin domain-containing protein n=1 Tax=Tepidiforma flava TaxID=3004094 RepID=A0ABY7M7N4_9CHLR|nr:hypothetical protein [Tepidiforma flava]WBL36162.1 hypothetical protein O0235_00635 [Tepidiforma flava]